MINPNFANSAAWFYALELFGILMVLPIVLVILLAKLAKMIREWREQS